MFMINTEEQYQEAVRQLVDRYRGQKSPCKPQEMKKFQNLAIAIVEYERENYPM